MVFCPAERAVLYSILHSFTFRFVPFYILFRFLLHQKTCNYVFLTNGGGNDNIIYYLCPAHQGFPERGLHYLGNSARSKLQC